VHDALGTALYYLLAGAPFLIGNLWDVTDKDIDKLCMAYMASILDLRGLGGGDSNSESNGDGGATGARVAGALVQCRNVCRMANAVGSAPVLYGIPTLLCNSTAAV
jgi:separase